MSATNNKEVTIPEWVTLGEAAKILGIGRCFVERLRREGELEGKKMLRDRLGEGQLNVPVWWISGKSVRARMERLGIKHEGQE